MKYLRIFEKESDYTQYVGGSDDYVTPHVALIRDTNIIKCQIYEPDYTNDYLTIEALEDDFNVSFSLNTIQYSIDNCQTWNELTADTTTPAINAGDKISFKANGLVPVRREGIGTFTASKRFNISGTVMSMLFGDEGKNSFDLNGYDFVFTVLFRDCTTLQSVSKDFLPATTLANNCYSGMFNGCTSLITAPELPATTLTNNCYNLMFNGCTSLITAPELPATTLANSCYSGMFNGCTSLITAPELPATTLSNECYSQMFYDCTSLVNAPELPATTLTEYCYNGMFRGCTSLTTAPELPATELANGCYSGMFHDCTSLNYIKMLATDISASNCLNNWVEGVSPTGTFVKNTAATWNVTGSNGIPEGWTVETVTA